ncbi:MAG TPA: metal ABC transporter substrate-binding protein, partial [Thermomicrobiales bacterium]|nr:metal ABC transporter substrate-binding protein [Thermomicrobiales bacterium]
MVVWSWLLAAHCILSPALPAAAQAATPPSAAGPQFVSLPAAAPRAGRPLNVVTTTPLLADLVRQIGGDRVSVQSLLPPNADPHDFEPRPADLVAVEQANLIVEHGLDLDYWADQLVANAEAAAP